MSAGLTKFAGGIGGGKFGITGKGFGAMFGRVTVAGVIGGVAARISGGRFWSGFQTGAFQRLFNDESHGDGYFARKIGSFKAWASGFSKRYINFVERYAISLNVAEGSGLLAAGPWSKRWVPFTGGRPAALGSHNPLTSVPRAFRLPAGKMIGRIAMPAVAPLAVGVGFYNTTVLVEGLFYAY